MLVVVGWDDELHVIDGSLYRRKVEGLVDLVRVTSLEDAVLIWSSNKLVSLAIVPLSLGCRARFFPGCSL